MSAKLQNILITGGAGFIGTKLTEKLLAKGYNIRILDNLSEQIHGNMTPEKFPHFSKVDFMLGDVRKKPDWEKAIEGINVIVHLAAETGTGQSMYDIEKYTEVNIQGTSLMLDVLTNSNHSVKKVVVASSRAIYGEGKYKGENLGYVYPGHRADEDMAKGDFEVKYKGEEKPLELCATDEESKIHPSSVYGITKQVQEQLVMTVCPTIDISPVAFRYQNVYGPGQSLSNPYTGILSIFSTQIRNGNAINIFEDGQESRDFVFVDDIADATILGIEKEEANNQVFNVGAGEPTNVMEVTNRLIEAYNANVEVNISGNYRLGDIRHNYADLTKISSLLGFGPKVTFEEGIKKFAGWVMQQEIKEDKYSKAMDEMKEKGLYKTGK